MTVATYEVKFHALSLYTLQFITTKDEWIKYFVKGLNSGI